MFQAQPPAAPVSTVQAPATRPMRLPREVDLRPKFSEFHLEPRAQGGRGTCSLFAMAGVLEFEYAQNNPTKPERFSVEFLNWASHQTNHRKQDGSFFSDAIKGVKQFGICAEETLPYASNFDTGLLPPAEAMETAKVHTSVTAHWIKEWDVKTGLTAAQLLAIRRSLAEGHPVAVGLRWPKKETYDQSFVLNKPAPEEVFDGHSIVFVGYQQNQDAPGGGYLLFRNSAGPEWGLKGYAQMSYAYALAYANDAVSLEMPKTP